jgi:glycosyltransferase involved in cell wall biosynthesis
VIILHHINQLGIGGTEKTAGILVKYLRKEGYDARLLVPTKGELTRLAWCETNNIPVQLYSDENAYKEACKSADIVHLHRGGWPEPIISNVNNYSDNTAICETNVFGFVDPGLYLKLSLVFFISDAAKPAYDEILLRPLPNPIERPSTSDTLNRPPKAFIIGRIQRPDINNLCYAAHEAIDNADSSVCCWIVNPEEELRKHLSRKHHFKLPIILDHELSMFYNTIDVLIANRINGESFGCAIQEAAMHGTPSLIHRGNLYTARNAHIDIFEQHYLNDWIVPNDGATAQDWLTKYTWAQNELATNREEWSNRFRKMAMTFDASKVTGQLIKYYKEMS